MIQGWMIHIYLQDIPHFDSLILLNTSLCNFPLLICFGWQHFLLFISTGHVEGELICFYFHMFWKNFLSIWANFNHVFEMFYYIFFTFLLQWRDALGTRLEKQSLNFSGSALFHMKTRVFLKYFVNHYLWKQFPASRFLQSWFLWQFWYS